MKRITSLILLYFFAVTAYGQYFGVKSNVLYDLTSSVNLGVEIGFGRKVSLDVSGNYNPWTFGANRKIQHWLVQPELRLWSCETFAGHFFGVHGIAGHADVSGLKLPFKLYESLNSDGHKGYFYGGGVAYGYQWILSQRWGFEATVGVGYINVKYDTYSVADNRLISSGNSKGYFGPTKIGLTFIYLIR